MRKLSFWLVWLMVFVIPWENTATLEGIGTITRLVGPVAAAVGVVTVLATRSIRRPGPLLLAIIPLMVWNALTFFWSYDAALSTQRLWTYAQLLVLIWLIWEFSGGPKEYLVLMQAYVLGAFVSVMGTFRNFALGQQSRGYLRYAATNFNPDDLGLTLALAIPLAWYLAIQRERHTASWIYRLYPPLALGAVLLTASRSAFISTMLGMSIIPMSFSRLSLRSKVVVSTFALATALVVATRIPAYSWNRLSTTWSEITEGTLGGRTVIWRAGAAAFSEHPVVGIGAGAFREGSGLFLHRDRAAHNTFLSILVELGIVGFALFSVVVMVAFLSASRMPPLEQKLWLALALTWSAGVMALVWEDRKPTWVLLGLLASQAAAWHWRRAAPATAGVTLPSSPALSRVTGSQVALR